MIDALASMDWTQFGIAGLALGVLTIAVSRALDVVKSRGGSTVQNRGACGGCSGCPWRERDVAENNACLRAIERGITTLVERGN